MNIKIRNMDGESQDGFTPQIIQNQTVLVSKLIQKKNPDLKPSFEHPQNLGISSAWPRTPLKTRTSSLGPNRRDMIWPMAMAQQPWTQKIGDLS